MGRTLRVVHCGLGPIGQGIARLVLETEGLKVVGASDPSSDKAGKDLGDAAGIGHTLGIPVAYDSESLLKDTSFDDTGRVRRLYLKAYGRDATDAETAKAIAMVRDVERALQKREPNLDRRRLLAWSSLCQVVVSANEFIYVQ